MYTTASHLSLFSARLMESSQHILFNVRFNVTIHLVQHHQSSPLSSCFPIKSMYTLLLHSCHILHPSCLPLYHHPKTTWSVQIMKPPLCNSLHCPTISSLSCPSSTLHSQMPSTCSSLNVSVQVIILIIITTTTSNCINIISDVSYVFYMILRHTEGS